jgi:hypothetical protein
MRCSVELVSCRNVSLGEGLFCPRSSGGKAEWWAWRVLARGKGSQGEGYSSPRAECHVLCKLLTFKSV